MRIEFADLKLQRLATDPRYTHGLGAPVVKAFRKAVGYLDRCTDERDIRAIRGYHFKQLERERAHQWSMRLNDQFRLILEFNRDDVGKVIVLVEVGDYH